MPFILSACDYSIAGVSACDLSNFMKPRLGEHRLIQTGPGGETSDIKYKEFGRFEISEHGYGSAVELRIPPMQESYHFQFILSGNSEWNIAGQHVRLQQGDSIVIPPGDEYAMRYSPDCRKLIVKIPRSFLHQSAREFGYLASCRQIEFRRTPLPFDDSVALHNLLNDILAYRKCAGAERVSLYYCKLLTHAILSTYDSNLCLPHIQTRLHDRQLEQVHHFLLDNITGELTIEDLAQHCRISRKSLYNLFERELKMTPSAYIRRLRLESVHHELARNPGIRNITEVALKYGFTNLGRFAAQYREHIGELPSETLRRQSRCA